MLTFLARRIISGFLMLFAISVVAFSLLSVNSAHAARRILGDLASEAAVAQRTIELGLDRTLPVQYFDWLTSLFQGDLGNSWFRAASVNEMIGPRLIATLSLVMVSLFISATIAMFIGVLAAVKRGSWIDRAVQTLSLGGAAIPSFLLAIALVMIFVLNLGWFAPTGFTDSQNTVR